MQKKLTEVDKKKLKKINLFRYSNDWYWVTNFVSIAIFLYSFFMPYYGWRRKPTHIPENFEEYSNAIIEQFLFFSPLYILVLSNFLIKKIEQNKNYKTEKNSVVILKRKIWNKKGIIIFKSFHILFYSNSFKYFDIEEKDKVLLEITSLGRLLNYKKIN